MASGMEMMLKALGIDPGEIQKAMTETIGRLQSGIAALDTRLTSIDKALAENNARLERLEIHLGVAQPESQPNGQDQRRISRQ